MSYEVQQPILGSPFDEPARHWYIEPDNEPELRGGRRPPVVFPPQDRRGRWEPSPILFPSSEYPGAYRLELVDLIRTRLREWRAAGRPGVTRTTAELLRHWDREGRQRRLFFAQREAAETVVFLTEARADFLQGVEVPRDLPEGGFKRYACKMATGTGKTTVMAMLAAWSILNKVNDRQDARFSDAVLAVCPNVTIRDRLGELDPRRGDASLYRTLDLVPPHRMADLTQGHVLVTNWHAFEPQSVQVGGENSRVLRAGVAVTVRETITIGEKTTTARGRRYLTLDDFRRQRDAGLLKVLTPGGEPDARGKIEVESTRHVESDAALVRRLLERDVGGKRNLLVLNDEAHHAYRIQRERGDDDLFDDDEDADEFVHEATVWVEGLDRIRAQRGINFCVDLSATPYYLGAVGADVGKPFPWVVSDFGLIDAIESGLVKVPQLALRDTTGAERPAYFNVWKWILPQLTASERGPKRANPSPKPEAVLKYAHHPITLLGTQWQAEFRRWRAVGEARPPVFIVVCKNTQIAKVVHEWLADDVCPANVPPAKLEEFRNRDGRANTIRVDSKVVHETDSGQSRGDESLWMRHTLNTVGLEAWPPDALGRPQTPEGFEELAKKLQRPIHPPGRDVRCIVSVGMLTEGWDCRTVTHVIGLRPFMSQLLCEQVVGRGLRRRSYDVGDDGLLTEEVAQVLGVPFEVVPFKATQAGNPQPQPRKHHVHAQPSKLQYAILFPRVEGYTQAVRNRVAVDWGQVPELTLTPDRIPPEVEAKAISVTNTGRLSLSGPGRVDQLKLDEFRRGRRVQELAFDLAKVLTGEMTRGGDGVPAHALFPQLVPIVNRFLKERVKVRRPADLRDVFLSPYFGWVVERLRQAIRPDTSQGEAPEVPRYESSREAGTTSGVSFWTAKEVREVRKCHLNYVVADTKAWEQQAAYLLDTHPAAEAFVKNQGLEFAIPYFHNGEPHDYYPDFLVRLACDTPAHLILEVKGYDTLEDIKRAAAERWVAAVNAEGSCGRWRYAMAKQVSDIAGVLVASLADARKGG